MSILSTITVNGTGFTSPSRSQAGIVPNELNRTLEGGYDSFSFHELHQSPFPSYRCWQPVALDINTGSGAVRYFSGEIVSIESAPSETGWTHAYNCLGLRFQGDRIPITAIDGSGTAYYNRTPDDPYYLVADTGLSIGTIIQRILTVPTTANALNAIGIGNYTSLSPPTLPAQTVTDLGLLTVVPPSPVVMQGSNFFSWVEGFIAQWMPAYFILVQPDGTIRVKNVRDLTVFLPQTVTVGTDPVRWPRVTRSTQNCYTRVVIRGMGNIEGVFLSLVDGTLAEVFTSADKTNWNLTYYTNPQGATDYGTLSSVTSTSAVMTSNSSTRTWATNFWANNSAFITMVDTVNTGIQVTVARLVTSNAALAAGGTASVTWDSSNPIPYSTYTKYRIAGSAGGLNDCWRTYTPREPSTGHTGLNTYIGAHLVPYSPKVVQLANNAGSFGENYPAGVIVGSLGQSIPLGLQVVPAQGIFRFVQPTVTVYGNQAKLNSGSPTTPADGLPTDVQVYCLYSRGPLSVTYPPDVSGSPQYLGTAYTEDNVTETKYIEYPNWMFAQDSASFSTLAQHQLESMYNAEVNLTIEWVVYNGIWPSWDPLQFGYSLNVALQGGTSPWSSLNAPIRGVTLRWCTGPEGATHILTFQCSTRARPFSGDALYVHPQYRQGAALYDATRMVPEQQGNLEAYQKMLAQTPLGNLAAEMGGKGNWEDYSRLLQGGGARALAGGTSVPAAQDPFGGLGMADAAAIGMPWGGPVAGGGVGGGGRFMGARSPTGGGGAMDAMAAQANWQPQPGPPRPLSQDPVQVGELPGTAGWQALDPRAAPRPAERGREGASAREVHEQELEQARQQGWGFADQRQAERNAATQERAQAQTDRETAARNERFNITMRNTQRTLGRARRVSGRIGEAIKFGEGGGGENAGGGE